MTQSINEDVSETCLAPRIGAERRRGPRSAIERRRGPGSGAGRRNRPIAGIVIRPPVRAIALSAITVTLVCIVLPRAIGADPVLPRSSLRAVVEGCVLAQRFALTFPCLRVGAKGRGATPYVVLRVPGSRTHLLVMPAEAIPGLEDPRLQAAPYGSLWAEALATRPLVSEGAGFAIPDALIGLAVNADRVRSQDQLHIHVECIRPRYLQSIRAQAAGLGRDGATKSLIVAGEYFVARRIGREDVEQGNLFALLASESPASAGLSGLGALLVSDEASPQSSGADDGMLLLAAPRQERTVEKLLDHGCERTGRLLRAAR